MSKNLLETLRDVLLVFTIIMLVYVLYKRLLVVLGKEKKQKIYPTIGEKIIWDEHKKAVIEVSLMEKMPLSLFIFAADGKQIQEVLHSEFEEGKHQLKVDCSQLNAGRYYFKIISPKQESSQYFLIA